MLNTLKISKMGIKKIGILIAFVVFYQIYWLIIPNYFSFDLYSTLIWAFTGVFGGIYLYLDPHSRIVNGGIYYMVFASLLAGLMFGSTRSFAEPDIWESGNWAYYLFRSLRWALVGILAFIGKYLGNKRDKKMEEVLNFDGSNLQKEENV